MSFRDGRFPPPGSLGGADDDDHWADWDPNGARRGYTGHVRALRDLDLPRDPVIDLPAPTGRQHAPGAGGALGPAGLAASARVASEDYLTASYELTDPGFVEIQDAVIVPQWSAPFGRLLLSVFLTLPRDGAWQVLDVACGTGYPTLELARFLGSDCDIAGIDVWPEAIQLARRRAQEEWLRNVSFLVADVTTSGLPERTFDTITCNLGLPSFADRAAALGAIWRLLRPEGQFLMTLPLQSALREFLDTYYLTLRDLKLDDAMRAFAQLTAARPTTEQARTLVERAGFEVRRVVTDSFTLRFPDPKTFLGSPLVQTTYMPAWRSIIPDTTVRRLVFNEVERRLTARMQASGGELTMTVPMACISAVRL